MPANPLISPSPDPAVPFALAELKQHLLLFVDTPPGPKTARAVYDLYMRTWGDPFRRYCSTDPGYPLLEWTPEARQRFEQVELLRLRRFEAWGYGFFESRATDAWLMMFHGYRPSSEPGHASFFRFEFDWALPPERLLRFTQDVLGIVRCVSGYAGYFFQAQANGPLARSSFNQVYALARRYWGVEAEDLDVTAKNMLDAYKCPSWLTVIGQRLESKDADAVAAARSVAYRWQRLPGGLILQAGAAPELGDRHRHERLATYEAIAQALLPLQVRDHASFGGTRWTADTTNGWLQRFTAPDAFARMP
ncbi:type VI immunity family protein [Caballeronia sp. S22]|uniref:type VI immunity family protein n=1 Tax=Caballeronia sp. S22 TaxID=3137182 RepID=UPI00353071FD